VDVDGSVGGERDTEAKGEKGRMGLPSIGRKFALYVYCTDAGR
jgi:hypothetical protein